MPHAPGDGPRHRALLCAGRHRALAQGVPDPPVLAHRLWQPHLAGAQAAPAACFAAQQAYQIPQSSRTASGSPISQARRPPPLPVLALSRRTRFPSPRAPPPAAPSRRRPRCLFWRSAGVPDPPVPAHRLRQPHLAGAQAAPVACFAAALPCTQLAAVRTHQLMRPCSVQEVGGSWGIVRAPVARTPGTLTKRCIARH